MKTLSKRTKLILTLISLVLIVSLGVGIALSMLTYEDPIDQTEEILPLGDYDYSKRPFIASNEPTVYKGDIYWRDPYHWLRRISISDLSCDIRDSQYAKTKDMYFPKSSAICSDESHNHGTREKPGGDCPDYKVGSFLIDAYESAGGSPIIYRTQHFGFDISLEDAYGEIVRYDTGNMKTETIVSTSDLIDDVMTYDQWMFFTTVNAEGIFSLNVISKKGGKITTLEVGKHGWYLMWANDDHVYYQDTAGNIYRATLDLQNPEFFFYAETISARDPERIGTFIHDDYLYFESDYEIVPFYIGNTVINFAKHTIRRVTLDNVYGESELVAENVLDNFVFGVGNNVLYYQPCIMGETTDNRYDFNWTGGQLLGVNLDTLEPAEMVNDVGLNMNGQTTYAKGSALIVHAFPTDGRYYRDADTDWGMLAFFLDTTTGALYPLSVNMFYD